MMRSTCAVISVWVIIFSFAGCDLIGTGVTATGDRLPGDSIQTTYYADAQQLAVRAMVAENDTTVRIPDRRVRPFYSSLLAVYNARQIPVRDSVLGIHTRPQYSLHEIVVGVDRSIDWTAAWENDQQRTGFAPIDDLLEMYDLSLKRYLDLGDRGAAVLRSEDPVNPIGLRSRFDGITGVRYVESNGRVGGQTDIRADKTGSTIRLHYSRGWGDCVAGCIHEKTWTFQVDAGGTVTFEEVTIK